MKWAEGAAASGHFCSVIGVQRRSGRKSQRSNVPQRLLPQFNWKCQGPKAQDIGGASAAKHWTSKSSVRCLTSRAKLRNSSNALVHVKLPLIMKFVKNKRSHAHKFTSDNTGRRLERVRHSPPHDTSSRCHLAGRKERSAWMQISRHWYSKHQRQQMSQNILIKEKRTAKEGEYSNWVASMTSDFYDKHSHNNLSYVKRCGHVKMNSLSTGWSD